MDAYRAWLSAQAAMQQAQGAPAPSATTETPRFELTAPKLGSAWNPAGEGLQLAPPDPGLNPTPDIAGMDLKLTEPAMLKGYQPPVDGASMGTMAGAGISAAGQAVGILAQLAGEKAARDAMIASNAENRAASEKLARMSLAQNARQFDTTTQANAYQQLMRALGQAGNNTMQQRALTRANYQNRGDALTTAFLGA